MLGLIRHELREIRLIGRGNSGNKCGSSTKEQVLRRMKLPKRYMIVLLTFISTFICYVERVGFSIAYTVEADAAGVNQSIKGSILSTFYHGYACSQVAGGWAAQRVGGRCVLLVSFTLWSLTCGFVPTDPNHVIVLVIARFLVGMAQGFIFPSIHTVLAQWVQPHERSRCVSLATSGMYLGAAAGMLVLPSLVKLRGPRSVFLAEAALGAVWSVLWLNYASDPPLPEHPKSNAARFGHLFSSIKESQKIKVENVGGSIISAKIPWKSILVSLPDLVCDRNQEVPKHNRICSCFCCIGGTSYFPHFGGAVFCSSMALGFLALGRAGFAVNHMDIAPRYAGIVMGVSNTAGTLAGIIGVDFTGRLLEAAKTDNSDLLSPESWKSVFMVPGVLCIISSLGFLLLSTGERIFD
nr:putative anion transporter 5 [Quercus suber]